MTWVNHSPATIVESDNIIKYYKLLDSTNLAKKWEHTNVLRHENIRVLGSEYNSHITLHDALLKV